jgi:hypothetical protein
MPIDKITETDVDSSSITTNRFNQRVLCCYKCGEFQFTLRGVKDTDGKRVKPLKFICQECFKKDE